MSSQQLQRGREVDSPQRERQRRVGWGGQSWLLALDISSISPALSPVFVVKQPIRCGLDSNFVLFTWAMTLLAQARVESLYSAVWKYLEVSLGVYFYLIVEMHSVGFLWFLVLWSHYILGL